MVIKKALIAVLLLGTCLVLFGHGNERATAEIEVKNTKVEVEYGRPIFKGVDVSSIPPGTLWRMGADKTTTLRTSGKLGFGEKVVSAGSYSLLAEKTGATDWSLIVNAEPSLRGTRRDPDQDAAQIPLKADSLGEPVELLTIRLDQQPEGGLFVLQWGQMQLSTEFSVLE